MNPPDIITTHDLSKYYGSHLGIQDVSFHVREGEIFGFLGPNGAGKTTTIRILLDLLRPDSGRVEIFGSDVRKHCYNIRKLVGYLPGEFSACEHLTGYTFFQLISRIRKKPFDSTSGLFKRFDLSERELTKKIKALSHGTLQKIGIIQALFHHPRLLILDEPTTGLDPLMKEVFYELIFEEQEKGTTIFFSSHNLDEVEKLCDQVAIIRKGRIAVVESLEILKERAGQVIEFTMRTDVDVIELPGAELIRHHGSHFTFRIKGDLQPILRSLAEMNIKDLSISKPDLEELFMEYYHDQNKSEDVIP